MKPSVLCLLAGLCCSSFLSYAAELSPIRFRITSQQFEPGDVVVIDEVLATSPDLNIGDTVVVRGRYRLESRPAAKLGFFLTTNGPSDPTPIAPQQQAAIKEGSGTFELLHVVPAEGRLH